MDFSWILDCFQEELRSGNPNLLRLSVILGLVESHFANKEYTGGKYVDLMVSWYLTFWAMLSREEVTTGFV